MLKVQYEHPPRSWKFYAGYLGLLGLVCAPVLILLATWWTSLGAGIASAAALFVTFLWLLRQMRFRTIEILYLNYYDRFLLKTRPSSSPDVPAKLQTAANNLNNLGFSTFSTLEHVFLAKQAPMTLIWLKNSGGDVIANLVEFKGRYPYFVRFVSCFAGDEVLITGYPIGYEFAMTGYRFTVINTSLEAAYQFHLRQVAEYEARLGSAIPMNNADDFMSIAAMMRSKYLGAELLAQARQVLTLNATHNLATSTTIFLGAFLIKQGFAPDDVLSYSGLLLLSLLYMLISVLIIFRVRWRGRDIAQAKKQLA